MTTTLNGIKWKLCLHWFVSIGWKCKEWCTSGHTSISDVTATVFDWTADRGNTCCDITDWDVARSTTWLRFWTHREQCSSIFLSYIIKYGFILYFITFPIFFSLLWNGQVLLSLIIPLLTSGRRRYPCASPLFTCQQRAIICAEIHVVPQTTSRSCYCNDKNMTSKATHPQTQVSFDFCWWRLRDAVDSSANVSKWTLSSDTQTALFDLMHNQNGDAPLPGT